MNQTRKTNRLPGLFFLLLLIGCKDPSPTLPTAEAQLTNLLTVSDSTYQSGNASRGRALFTEEAGIVTLTMELQNFTPNTVHAVHLHTGNCEQPAAHWNMGIHPMDKKFCNDRSLGVPWAKPMLGDVGNVSVGYDGTGIFILKTDLWSLGTGEPNDVVGTVLVIHAMSEDFNEECDPFHDHTHAHNNPKVACGTVELR